MQETHEARLDALEALLFALAHHLAVEAPVIARTVGARVRMHADAPEHNEVARRLFRSVGRLLEC